MGQNKGEGPVSGSHRRGMVWEIVVISLALLVTIGITSGLQQPISFNGGRGWDGFKFERVAEQFARHEPLQAQAPFVYRIGTPFLAAVVSPENLYFGFKFVNLAAAIVSVFLLYFWLGLYLTARWVRVALVVLYIAQWHAPVRFVFYAPLYTDPLMLVALLAGLILIYKIAREPRWEWFGWMSVLVFVGVLVREVVLVLPVALVVERFFSGRLALQERGRAMGWLYWVPLVCGAGALGLTHLIATQTNNYSFAGAAWEWLLAKHPWSYLQAWMIAFGPVLVLPLFNWRKSWAFLGANPGLGVCLGVFAVLGWIGGSDTERILYWSFPIVFVLIGKAIEDNRFMLRSKLFLVVLGGTQLIAQRVFWLVPDYPNAFPSVLPILTPPSANVPYLDLFSEFSGRIVQAVSIVEYAVLTIAMILWLEHQKRHWRESIQTQALLFGTRSAGERDE